VKAVEVHNLDDAQLIEFVDSSRQELFNLRFQHATGQLENTGAINGAKKDLARGLTIAAQRALDVEAELRKQQK
jgi:large subunit ribosomal protein L29